MYKSKKEKKMQDIDSTQEILKEIEAKCEKTPINNDLLKNKQNSNLSSNTIKNVQGITNKNNGNNNGTKKLTIKLENSGSEKQKLYLKVESGKKDINSENFNIISNLLKDFFS